jgi:tRNA A-37 threonylcarbamoyl transferase component Bud32/WD40 repeat protein
MPDIYDLFVQASLLDPKARNAWLKSIDLSSDSRNELDELFRALEKYEPGKTKVRTLILGTVERALPRPENRIGQFVGCYRLEHLVVDSEGRSAGNMGHVYRARRVDGAYDQTVAVKVIQQRRDDPESRQRFVRERRYLGRLRHPNIVRIIDAGALPAEPSDLSEEQPYFIMEWVEDGKDVASYCRFHGLSVGERVDVFIQFSEGVAYAHSQGVVHRDLKPQNVLVDVHGVPRLLDFGISSQAEDEGDAALLRSAMTLAYASPEQLGKRPVGPASDIYSLGIILYELLVGERPYEVSGDWEADRKLVETAVIPRVPGPFDLDQIVHKALERDLSRRYKHMDQMVRDLRRLRSRQPVQAAIDSLGKVWGPAYWVWRYAQKYAGPLAALAVFLAVAVALGVYFGREQLFKLQGRFKAVAPAVEAALAFERGEYRLAGSLALESAEQAPSVIARRILQQVLPHLPRRVFEAAADHTVRAVAFSADTERSAIVEVLENSSVEIRDARDGTLRQLLQAPGAGAIPEETSPCLAYSEDGRHLAVVVPKSRIKIWDLPNRTLSLDRELTMTAAAWQGFDCRGAGAFSGLRYTGSTDWDLLLPASHGRTLWANARGDDRILAETLGCAPARRLCLFRLAGGVALQTIDGRTAAQPLPGAEDGVLSPDGRWLAVRDRQDEVSVRRIEAGGVTTVWDSLGRSRTEEPLRFQSSGARLLLRSGAEWRVLLPQYRRSWSYHWNGEAPALPEISSFFTFETLGPDRVVIRPEIGGEPFSVETGGPVTLWAADDVSGKLLLVGGGGKRLSLWSLPSWPGARGLGASAMGVEAGRAWAAGWTASGALVLYSTVDGSIERVLEDHITALPVGAAAQVWAFDRVLLSSDGSKLRSWDVSSGDRLGSISGGVETNLVTDLGFHWLAVTASRDGRTTVYQLPQLRIFGKLSGLVVHGIASTDKPDEVAVLASEFPGPGHPAPNGQLLLEIFGPAPHVPHISEIVGDVGPIATLRPALGFPCASATPRSARRSADYLFPFQRVEAGRVTDCVLLRVDAKRGTVQLEKVAPPKPRQGSVETPVTTFPTETERWYWIVTNRGLAINEDGSWREVLFGMRDLEQHFCACTRTNQCVSERK